MRKKCLLFILLIISMANLLMAQSSVDTLLPFSVRATYYSDIFIGRHTSNGEIFQQDKFTAAHKTLPFGTLVLVTNLENGSQVIVKVNDRCPKRGILDLTKRAAKTIGIGSRMVRAQILPQRYEEIWANQHNLEHAMKEGCLLSLSLNELENESIDDSKDEKLAATDTVRSNMFVDTTGYYLILLGVADNRQHAEVLVNRMPMKYQSSIELLPGRNASRVRMILDMQMNYKEAEAVKKELESIFPKSQVRKANN